MHNDIYIILLDWYPSVSAINAHQECASDLMFKTIKKH